MDKDIVPELLELIDKLFVEKNSNNQIIKNAVLALKHGTATYDDVNKLSVAVGKDLASTLESVITKEVLPDGKMYFNISDRVLKQTLEKNYDIVSGYAIKVQDLINKNAGVHLKAQVPTINKNKIKGLVEKISSVDDFEKVSWVLDEPIVTFTQSIVDDFLRKNIKFQNDSGLKPKITRQTVGNACDWCKKLAGVYSYKETPNDVFRRHDRCRCRTNYSVNKNVKNIWE